MNGKITVGIAIIVGVVSLAFLAAPIQAYFNGTDSGNCLQMQEQERTRSQDCECNGDCTQTQCRYRQKANECVSNTIGNCTKNSEQYRHQYRERTRNPVD